MYEEVTNVVFGRRRIGTSELNTIVLGKGPKKCKSMVFYQIGGGVTRNQILIAKIICSLKLTICPQTYPIHKEIVVSAVLVINSLCGDHFLIA